MKRSILYALGIIAIGVVLSTMILFVYPDMIDGKGDEFPGDSRYNQVEYTDKNIYLIGNSEWTDVITERLKESTSHITKINSIDELSHITKNSLLMIDGFWLDSPDISIQKFISSLTAVFLKEVPVLLIGQTPNILYAAIDEYTTTGKDIGISVENNSYEYPNTTGIYLDTDTKTLDVYLSSEPYSKYGIEYKTTVLYNWGVTKLDKI